MGWRRNNNNNNNNKNPAAQTTDKLKLFTGRTPEEKVSGCPWFCELCKTKLWEQISWQWSVRQPGISDRGKTTRAAHSGASSIKLVKQDSAGPRIKTIT